MWKDLTKTLADINAAYEKIFDLGKKKHSYLVTVNLKALEPLLKTEASLADEVKRLEDRRILVLTKMAGTDKRLRPGMTMNELIAFAPAPMQHTLAVLHKQLSAKVEEVVKQSEINNLLATGALDAVTKKLNQLGGARVEGSYGRGGDIVSHRKNLEIKA